MQRANIECLALKNLLSEMQIANALEVPLKVVEEIKQELIDEGKLK